MAAPLTEAAIEQYACSSPADKLVPGQRLPPEAELAESLGTSRSTVREAVRALVTARVLDVRRGDGTFVTSLRPELLLAGIGAAADLLQRRFTLELVQVRRILEPAATAMAATRITDETLDELEACLHQMSIAPSHDELVQFDEEFHQLVATASGNATLASMLNGVSSRTTPGSGVARCHRSRCDGANDLRARRDSRRASCPRSRARRGAALLHVSTTETWFRPSSTHDVRVFRADRPPSECSRPPG